MTELLSWWLLLYNVTDIRRRVSTPGSGLHFGYGSQWRLRRFFVEFIAVSATVMCYIAWVSVSPRRASIFFSSFPISHWLLREKYYTDTFKKFFFSFFPYLWYSLHFTQGDLAAATCAQCRTCLLRMSFNRWMISLPALFASVRAYVGYYLPGYVALSEAMFIFCINECGKWVVEIS